MPGEHSKHYYSKNDNDNNGHWMPTREAPASTQNGQMSQDSPKLEQEEQQRVTVSIVGRENVGVFDQQDESDTDEHLVIHAPPINSLFQEDHQQNGENDDETNSEYVPHTPTATPPPTPPSLPSTPFTADDLEEPPFQDQQVKQERPSPPTSPVNKEGFLNLNYNRNPPQRPHLPRESTQLPEGLAIQTAIDHLLNVTNDALRFFDRMAGMTPEQPPHTPYFSFFPGPGMYPIPTQLYCSYPFLLKCLSVSMSFISFREQHGASTSSNGHNEFSGNSRPREPTSSAPTGFGTISAPPSTSSSRKSSRTLSATVTSQSSNISGSCGRRMFAPPPPLLSPIRDGPPTAYFVPFAIPNSTPTLSSPTSSSAWRFTVPILHLQQPPSRQEQERPLNFQNNDRRNLSSLSVPASSSQMRPAVGDTRGRRRDDGERFSRRDEIRSSSRSQNRFRNEQIERTGRRTDVNYHHHHYHGLSPHSYPYLFSNNCRHRQDQRRCDYCRNSGNSLLNFDYHASSSSLRRRRDHNVNDGRGRRRNSREGRNGFKSKSDYDRRDHR